MWYSTVPFGTDPLKRSFRDIVQSIWTCPLFSLPEVTINQFDQWAKDARVLIDESPTSNIPLPERAKLYLLFRQLFPEDGQLRFGILSYLVATDLLQDWDMLNVDEDIAHVPHSDLELTRRLLNGTVGFDEFRDHIEGTLENWQWAENKVIDALEASDRPVRGIIAPRAIAFAHVEFCRWNSTNSAHIIENGLDDPQMDIESLDTHARGAFNVSGFVRDRYRHERGHYWSNWLDRILPQVLAADFRKIIEPPT